MNRFAALLTLTLTACSPWQLAAAQPTTPFARSPGLADIQVFDRASGQTMPIYRHNGELWVAGVPGHRYAVRVHNTSPGRILTVVSVDGVNAVTGETAGWNQGGYVLTPWESYDVAGWRKSQERVADFVFTALEDSYAAATGRPQDVGVIGVAVFRERIAEPPVTVAPNVPMFREESDAAAAPSATASAAPSAAPAPAPVSPGDRAVARSLQGAPLAESLGALDMQRSRIGTGHGQSEYSYVGNTHFERAHTEPDFLVAIRYDRPETLVAMGIMPAELAQTGHPRAFPDSAALGFVPDPPVRR